MKFYTMGFMMLSVFSKYMKDVVHWVTGNVPPLLKSTEGQCNRWQDDQDIKVLMGGSVVLWVFHAALLTCSLFPSIQVLQGARNVSNTSMS